MSASIIPAPNGNSEIADALNVVNKDITIISAEDQEEIYLSYDSLIDDGVDDETAKDLTLERIRLFQLTYEFEQKADQLFQEVEARKAQALRNAKDSGHVIESN